MLDKPIDQITEDDLTDLVTNEEVEQKTLEYKSDLPGTSQTDKGKFLAEISSFANTIGGTLVFGIATDDNHVPVAVDGMDIDDVDKEIQRLDQIARSGITPRLPSMTIKPLRLASGKYVILIRVGRSWIAPHMVSSNDSQRFYIRLSNGKNIMDVVEIGEAFRRGDYVAGRMRNFVHERYAMTYSDETPVPIKEGLKLACHIIPFTITDSSANPTFLDGNDLLEKMRPLTTSGNNGHFNVDGFCTDSPQKNGVHRSYTQLFHNGVVESVVCIERENRIINHLFIEDLILQFYDRYLPLVEQMGISTPLAIHSALLSTKGYRGEFGFADNCRPITRDQVLLPTVQLNDYRVDVKTILRPVFDAVSNAAGRPRSPSYDADGNWKRQPSMQL